MTLSARIAATRCMVFECQRARAKDAAVCSEHLADMWHNQLTRQPDGSFVPARRWIAKDLSGRMA